MPEETKWFLLSKRVWGALLIALPPVLEVFGWTIDERALAALSRTGEAVSVLAGVAFLVLHRVAPSGKTLTVLPKSEGAPVLVPFLLAAGLLCGAAPLGGCATPPAAGTQDRAEYDDLLAERAYATAANAVAAYAASTTLSPDVKLRLFVANELAHAKLLELRQAVDAGDVVGAEVARDELARRQLDLDAALGAAKEGVR